MDPSNQKQWLALSAIVAFAIIGALGVNALVNQSVPNFGNNTEAQLTPQTKNYTVDDDTAKRDITTKLSLAVENKFSKIGTLNITFANDTNGGSIMIYNKTSFYNVTLPPVVNNTQPPVVNNTPPTPEPQPQPQPAIFELVFTGDVKGTAVPNAIKKENANYTVVNGDLFYESTLSTFKSSPLGELKKQDKLGCTQGNHDAEEDGSAKLGKETLEYCGQHWYKKIANGKAIVIGFTTNGNAATEAAYVNSITSNSTIMDGVKLVFLASHKNGHVPPDAHHGAEAKSLYEKIQGRDGVKFLEVSAHNHFAAAAPEKGWFISGNGGKSHYSCDTDQTWTFCNNDVYGYLKFEINDSTAEYTYAFLDTSGKVLTK